MAKISDKEELLMLAELDKENASLRIQQAEKAKAEGSELLGLHHIDIAIQLLKRAEGRRRLADTKE